MHSFNIAYRGEWPHDERHFAREVAERAGTVHHQVELDVARFPELLPAVAWHLGQPNADPIALSTYGLFEAVHQAGFKVALTGDAADEVFAGYGRIHAAVTTRGTWLPAYVDALAAIPAEARPRLYSADYRAFVSDRGSASDAITEGLRQEAAHRSRLDVLTDFETQVRLPAYHLRRVDHLSMAHAVEVRLPFCQRSVRELARALPQRHRLSPEGGRGKVALYAAARGLLPRSVLERPKQPFTLPITAMLAPGTPLWAYTREVLSPARLRTGGQLDPTAVERLLRAQRTRPADCLALATWSLLMFELWREEFAVRRAASRPAEARELLEVAS
ncbi:asparagine synthetase B family protein [Streptacidiphilus neutrinimicus]|uniref:asparagine synthetase B family protein n=1 Tax=Streptacidiphilus neutrinimicus TaxID=105420 RepID=UPI001F2E9166|nr:asparagine synthase C-terminal domain-containing protein [Streptacidiphilus neutrinimicus]